MKNEQILKKAIEKAVKNGYSSLHTIEVLEYGLAYPKVRLVSTSPQVNTIIFSHDFAKAFFGDEISQHDWMMKWIPSSGYPTWQYHLQQMVLKKDPILYLEKFL